jgi:hypothetical protein
MQLRDTPDTSLSQIILFVFCFSISFRIHLRLCCCTSCGPIGCNLCLVIRRPRVGTAFRRSAFLPEFFRWSYISGSWYNSVSPLYKVGVILDRYEQSFASCAVSPATPIDSVGGLEILRGTDASEIKYLPLLTNILKFSRA